MGTPRAAGRARAELETIDGAVALIQLRYPP